MECVIFSGLPASGKSTFYKERFFNTHIRINLDMLRTRRREEILLRACIEARQPFVVDNTNITRELRAHYISLARQARFRVVGYHFSSGFTESVARNSTRDGKARVPNAAIAGFLRRLEIPSYSEGYDQLFLVSINQDSNFVVEELEQ